MLLQNRQNLSKPLFILAPMDDVTETVFRQIVESCGPADLYITEFVNVDGLQSPGRPALLHKLRKAKSETKLIAQVWGKNPDNFYKTAQDVVEMGFAGIDINFGCPVKTIVKNGCCSAFILPENRERAIEIIQAVKKGVNGKIPVSVKTRLGYNSIDLSWHELLLKQKLNMLIVHGRTKKDMSKVPSNWDQISKIRALRDKLAPSTLIIGNGDVMSKAHGLELIKKHKLDGVMIGRGIFNDPFIFADKSPWPNYTREQRIALLKKHVQLFAKTWSKGERRFETLKKFAKVYISDFDGASELRAKVMDTTSADELLGVLAHE